MTVSWPVRKGCLHLGHQGKHVVPLRRFAKVSTDTTVAALASNILVYNVPTLYFQVRHDQLHVDRRMHMLGQAWPVNLRVLLRRAPTTTDPTR